MTQCVLVTGASKGIGYALVQQYLQRGSFVIATVRDVSQSTEFSALKSERLRVVTMDVGSTDSVQRAKQTVSDLGVLSIDVLFNNAAVNGAPHMAPDMNIAQVEQVMSVNAVGPVRVYNAFAPWLRAAKTPAKLVNISSEAGSVSNFRLSGKPEYAMSKAALNVLTQWIAGKERQLICVSLDPGWTKTSMGGQSATFTPEQTAERIANAVEKLTIEHSGKFFDAALTATPW